MNKGYGFDRLSRDILILAGVLNIAAIALWNRTIGLVLCGTAVLLDAMVIYRMLSPNITRRQDELIGYEKLVGAVGGFFKRIFGAKKESDGYKYFKCPSCGQELRAPKGKGRIRVTCSKCGMQFEKKV